MRLVLVLCLMSGASFAADPCVKVTQKDVPNGLELWADLSTCTEATFTVSADETNAVNQLPSIIDAAGRTHFLLANWRRERRGAEWSVRDWKYRFKIGRRLTLVPNVPDGAWRLPFDGKHKLIQGPRGTFSHNEGSEDEEAFDWAMAPGTPVLAARQGVVVAVRADCTEGGVDEALRDDANYVILRHDDGLFSIYNHMQFGGPNVKLGDRVQQGQRIGLSGNTGYTSAPHLHFAVYVGLDGDKRRTVPVIFGDAVEPAPRRQTQAPTIPAPIRPPPRPRALGEQKAVDDAAKAFDGL
jgi:murein DD-endopeptidase MepM/ murein hydrolase activator NlpD